MTSNAPTPGLERGDLVPHFAVTTIEGAPVSYGTIWQLRNLVLIALPPGGIEASACYLAQFTAHGAAFAGHQAQCVATRDPIAGINPPAVIVADRWGEVMYAAAGRQVADLPPVDAVIDWLEYVQHRCPECEGEAR
jgi:hypothetical protein